MTEPAKPEISLGDRMKMYENTYRVLLTPKNPVIVRLDGNAFSTMTRRWDCDKPFDSTFIDSMIYSAEYVISKMQGFRLCYVQSDEASFLIDDLQNEESQPWFGNNMQKIVTIAASAMASAFGKYFEKAKDSGCCFDGRAFIVPQADIPNYFLWRMRDHLRNSISMLARSVFSHNVLQNKNSGEVLKMLEAEGINFLNLSNPVKFGTYIDHLNKKSYIAPQYEQIKTFIQSLGVDYINQSTQSNPSLE